jgi:endo-1,4-beta-xylanase
MTDPSARPRSRRAGFVAGGVTAALLAGLGLLAVSEQAGAVGTTLGAAAAGTGRYFGTAVQSSKLADPVYTGLLDREFTAATPENVLALDVVEPARGVFSFTPADRVIDAAAGKKIRGEVLTVSGAQPSWLLNLGADDLRSALRQHISTLLAHYQGRVYAWDVVREAFSENGTRRPSRQQSLLGDGYIEDAFRVARAADPSARLCYSDYNTDDWTTAKTQAVYAMVRDFQARGVPLDCVAFESHFTLNTPPPANYQETLQRFADLGVEVQISELDIEGSGAVQAERYQRVTSACVAVARCAGITVWGIRDPDSWRSGSTPLLFDGQGNKKPAYVAVIDALNRLEPTTTSSTTTTTTTTTTTPSCSAVYQDLRQGPDRYTGRVSVFASESWTVTVSVRPWQRILAVTGARSQRNAAGTVATVTPAGSSTFEVTVGHRGDRTPPTLACQPS